MRKLFLQQNDFGVSPGTRTADVWKFTKCRPAGCKSVKKARSGKATKFTGTEKTKIQNCTLVHFVNYDLIGKLR